MNNQNANIEIAAEIRAIQKAKDNAAQEERFIKQLLAAKKIRSVSEYYNRKA